jgi:outer membrane receptor protein involved in Fe transport
VLRAWLLLVVCAAPAVAFGQDAVQPPLESTNFTVTVIGMTPLPGVELPRDQVPGPVQTATDQDIDRSGSLAVSDLLNRRLTSVYVNEVQSNPFQPDVNYRGYTASPLLGTPQGLSVYMDGVRLNQPFGEVVSWDLIPRLAIATTTLVPGSNPVFGLNTLGGALALQTKSGTTAPGTMVQGTYGSDNRRIIEFEHGGSRKSAGFDWYVTGSAFAEDGWRDDSPSDVRQLFGKIGWNGVTVSAMHADNSLNGNGLQAIELLDRNRGSVYTKPDTTGNLSTLVNGSFARSFSPRLSLRANGYFRHIRTQTLNGDINEDSLDQSLYQPTGAERAALLDAGYGSVPASGLNAGNTPFPSLRCIANVLLRDEPGETCNGLINRSHDTQRSGGASGQITWRDAFGSRVNVFTAGGAVDRSTIAFSQSSELGYVNPDRSISGVGAFADGVGGGDIDDVPFDTRVDLTGAVTTWSLYATDTVPVGSRAHVTLSGRYNRSIIDNIDHLHPAGADESLTGRHVFQRFNPAVGATLDVPHHLNLYANYGEGSRAATSIELGCANPELPCKLPNAMAGDPPLDQVITRTFEAGIRKVGGAFVWSAGAFFASNHNDILFVTSEQTGFGYFRNFGQTRRDGFELTTQAKGGRATVGAGYTYLRATFASAETLNGEGNSTNQTGPGLDGTIEIEPGDRLPLVPAHVFKIYGDVPVTTRLDVDLDLIATSSVYARGNENNAHQPDGIYYLGPGTTDAYAVVNLGARYRVTKRLQAIGRIDNLLDTRYATSAQLGPAGFTPAGVFVARPFAAVNGEFPLRHTTFLAPGAPIRAWLGARVRF